MMGYNSFITDDRSYRNILVNLVRNLSYVQILDSKFINSGRAIGYLMNFKKYSELDISECVFNSILISLEDIDDDWRKNIFIISNNLKNVQNKIQQWLNFEKEMSIFEEYANFYVFTNEKVEFDHPKVEVFSLKEVENKINEILKEEVDG